MESLAVQQKLPRHWAKSNPGEKLPIKMNASYIIQTQQACSIHRKQKTQGLRFLKILQIQMQDMCDGEKTRWVLLCLQVMLLNKLYMVVI